MKQFLSFNKSSNEKDFVRAIVEGLTLEMSVSLSFYAGD